MQRGEGESSCSLDTAWNFQQVLENLHLEDDLNVDLVLFSENDGYLETAAEVNNKDDKLNVLEDLAPVENNRSQPSTTDLCDVFLDDPFFYLEAAVKEDMPRFQQPKGELQEVMDAVVAETATPNAPLLLPISTTFRTKTYTPRGPQTLPSSELHGSLTGIAAVIDESVVQFDLAAHASPDLALQGPGSSGDTAPGQCSNARKSTTMLAVEAVDAAPTIQLQSRSSDAFHSPHATHRELGDSRQDLSKGGSSKLETQELRRQTFASLQPLCSVLLEHRKDPEELSQVLAGLEVLVSEMQPKGLSDCLDYLLFPLLLALDSIPSYLLQPRRLKSGGIPAMKSEQAAEAALSCLRQVLLQCGGCSNGEQLLSLLHRLSAVLLQPSTGAICEEVRLQALLCVSAALQGGNPAADACPQSVLKDESCAPLLGHLASVLLKCAESEAEAGHRGSKAVRAAALAALHALILAVGSADAMAFFVPGIVTSLGRSLAEAGAGVAGSGAALSSTSTVEALGALGALLVLTLGDNSALQSWNHPHATAKENGVRLAEAAQANTQIGASESALGAYDQHVHGSSHSLNASSALQRLRQLSVEGCTIGKAGATHGSSASIRLHSGIPPPARDETAAPVSSTYVKGDAGQEMAGTRFRVDRNWEWVKSTTGRLHDILIIVIPPLCAVQQPVVRQKLAKVCAQLLSCCGRALLPASRQLLYETLFVLAKDDWPDVAEVAQGHLQLKAAPGGATLLQGQQDSAADCIQRPNNPLLPMPLLEESLQRLLDGLPSALKSGDSEGLMHARKLATCIEVLPSAWFCSNVLGRPSTLALLHESLVQSFQFREEDAAVLAQSPPEAGTCYQAGKPHPRSTAALAGVSAPATPGPRDHALCVSGGRSPEPGLVVAQPLGGDQVAVLLPRMPVGLRLLHSAMVYQAVAGVCRAVAAKAAAAGREGDGHGGLESATALRRLLDHGLADLQRACEMMGAGGEGSNDGGVGVVGWEVGTPPAPHDAGEAWSLEQPWQLHAAAIVVVVSEMLVGALAAGGAGDPAIDAASSSAIWEGEGGAGSPAHHRGVGRQLAQQQELHSLILAFVEMLVTGGLWGLPTCHEVAGAPQITARQQGVNTLAVRVAVEAVGCCARVLGPAFARPGRMMRAVLLPVLERLGDIAPLVSSAAGATVGSICLHCGYGTLNRLVAENADYVVEGVCAQLRQLDRHPGAPRLLAVLMQKAGVGAELLPLLAEPARSAVQGVSILSRRRHPSHVLPFLLALAEIMYGACACAEAALKETLDLVAKVHAQQEERRQQAVQQQEVGGSAGANEGDDCSSGSDEVREYFLRRQQLKAAGMVEEVEGGGGASKVPLSPEQSAAMLLRKRRVHAAATLAQTAVDCCGPLALSASLQVAVQAQQVCTAGLRCLKATTQVLELEEHQLQPCIQQQVEVSPPDPLTPKLLPSVHLVWAPIMGALKDWRVSLIECTLGTLCELGAVAGSFLSRRFWEDAWPVLQGLLHRGPPRRQITSPGQDDPTSPASIQRTRCAVLACLHRMACDPGEGRSVAGSSGGGAEVLGPHAGAMLGVVGGWLGAKQAAVVKEQGTKAFMALARLDSDTAWTLLTTALAGHIATPSAATHPAPPDMHSGLFPPAPALCATNSQRVGSVPAALRECGPAKLVAMLAQVERLSVAWHEREGGTDTIGNLQ